MYLGSSPIFFALVAFSLELSHPLSKVTVRSFGSFELISLANLPSNQIFIRIKKEFRLVYSHIISHLLTSPSVRMGQYWSRSLITCVSRGPRLRLRLYNKHVRRELDQYSSKRISRSVNKIYIFPFFLRTD